jgi:phosphohistidine phosphatase
MAELGAAWAPTLALCSTARRAEATLAGARAALPTLAHSQLVPGLYLAGAGGLLGELRRAPDEHACVLVVAHEPGLSTLARALAVRAERAALARFARGMAPASFAALALDVARWEDARPGCGELAAFEPP